MSEHLTQQLDAAERLIGSGNLKGALLALLPVLRDVVATNPVATFQTATQFILPSDIGQQYWTVNGDNLTFNGNLRVTGDIAAGGDVAALTMSSTEDYTSRVPDGARGSRLETLPVSGEAFTPDGSQSIHYEIASDVIAGLAEIGIDAAAEVKEALEKAIATEIAENIVADVEASKEPEATEGQEGDTAPAKKRRGGRPPKSENPA